MENFINYLWWTIVLWQDRDDAKVPATHSLDIRTAKEFNASSPVGLFLKLDYKSSFAIKTKSISWLIIEPSVIVKTNGYYECHYIIKSDDQSKFQLSYSKELESFTKWLANIQWWEILYYARIPWSIDYTNNARYECDFETKWRKGLSYEDMKWYFNSYFIDIETHLESFKFFKKASKSILRPIMSIEIPELLTKLSSYPRDWIDEIILEKDNSITLREKWTWLTSMLPWYKYIPHLNKIVVVSTNENNGIDFPRWDVITFLFFYFWRNTVELWKFLLAEYKIILYDYMSDLKNVSTINYGWCTIEFKESWVFMTTIKESEDWPVPKTRIVFRRHVKIFGKMFTDVVDTLRWIVTTEIQYLCEDVNASSELLLKPASTKKEFNKMFLGKWISFYWTDEDINLFFEALYHSTDVPEIPCVDKNWFYDWFVVLWWKVLFWSPQEHYHFQPSHTFELSEWDQITPKEYLEKLQSIYSDRVASIALLQAIALAWMNIWSNISIEQQIAPSMFISWSTWTGKTTLVSMIKKALWYWLKSRIMSCWSTTPQPIKVAATDQSILFLEEFTDASVQAKEDLFRSIINREEWSRWMPGTNIKFIYKSNLFASWEMLPSAESLMNRFVTVYLKQEDAIGSYELINDMQRYSISRYIYNTYLTFDKQLFKKLYDEYRTYTIKLWYNARVAEVRTPIFVVNKMHKVWVKEDDIIEYMKYFLSSVWVQTSQSKKHDDIVYSWLKNIIFSAVMERQWHINVKHYDDDMIIAYLYFKQWYYNRNVWHINNYMEMTWLSYRIVWSEVRVKCKVWSELSQLIDGLWKNANINLSHAHWKANDLEDY